MKGNAIEINILRDYNPKDNIKNLFTLADESVENSFIVISLLATFFH